jgi:hypothetical protein
MWQRFYTLDEIRTIFNGYRITDLTYFDIRLPYMVVSKIAPGWVLIKDFIIAVFFLLINCGSLIKNEPDSHVTGLMLIAKKEKFDYALG